MATPIRDYALIGDTHSTALVAKSGSIDWLCWPRHDSPALLTRLLDETGGGSLGLDLDGLAFAGRSYVEGTNILETRFAGPAGELVVSDFMAVHPPPTARHDGPDAEARHRIVRLVTCKTGEVSGRFSARLTPDYGRANARFEQRGHAQVAELGASILRVEADDVPTLDAESGALSHDFHLRRGQRAFFAVTLLSDNEPEPMLWIDDAIEDMRVTRGFWQRWSAGVDYNGPHRDMVMRSALALKLLTYSPTGAIIAAPTTSLPEAVPGNRNFDYRFSWVRDASFTVSAFANLGLVQEAEDYLRFLHNADGSAGRDLKLLYPITGTIEDECELDHLPGWSRIGPVRIGNAAEDQEQHDIYGEFMVALHFYLETVDFDPPEWIGKRLPELVRNLAAEAMGKIGCADRGIWELRDGSQVLQHSQALLWVALDRAARIAEALPAGFDPEETARWSDEATKLRDASERESWNEAEGFYARAHGGDTLDAAVMRTVLFGALDADSPRMRSTLAAVEGILTDPADPDLVYRYRVDDGLDGDEASFLACAFWRVGVLGLRGDLAEAEAAFARLLAKANDVGLFSEEIATADGAFRGNFPQGFSHMCVINHAIRLAEQRRQTGPLGVAA